LKNVLAPELLESFRRLGTCAVSNAIETFDVRLRNAGFADASIRCMFQEFPPMIGYAATASVRTSVPPMQGHNYFDRTDWWNAILKIPPPRVVVVEDVEKHPGLGSFVGEVHANILSALGCVAVVTNGAVRDLPQVRNTGFQMFAGNVAVSHAYARRISPPSPGIFRKRKNVPLPFAGPLISHWKSSARYSGASTPSRRQQIPAGLENRVVQIHA
jgi:regulator of RNase E activity RraA